MRLIIYITHQHLILSTINEINIFYATINMTTIDNYQMVKIVTKDDANNFVKFIRKDNDEKIKKYVGIDFEFFKNDATLWQMAFFDNKIIFVIDPSALSEKNIRVIRRKLLCSRNYIKILHGSESLDLPYVFKLLNNNAKYFTKFIKYFVDTRFMCETIKSASSDMRCSLYDGLYATNTITEDVYKNIKNIEKSNGPIYKIQWNLKMMTQNEIYYAANDVRYLLRFYENMKKKLDDIDFVISFTRLVMINKMLHIIPVRHHAKCIPTQFDKVYKIDYFKSTVISLSSYLCSNKRDTKVDKLLKYLGMQNVHK
jgi:hypothetical protein